MLKTKEQIKDTIEYFRDIQIYLIRSKLEDIKIYSAAKNEALINEIITLDKRIKDLDNLLTRYDEYMK